MSAADAKIESVVVVGSGPAGLTAAIYAARANLSPLVIEGSVPGGQLLITSDVENYPGFPEPVLGPDLVDGFRKQATRLGTRFLSGDVTEVDASKGSPISLKTSNGDVVLARAVIVATGASARWLGVPNEARLSGRGVSACATCDGFFFKNKEIVVVGGGDTAMEEATFLTRFARKVTIIVRTETLRASKAMQDRAKANPKISFLWNTVVESVLGNDRVEGVRVKNVKTGETTELFVQGVFVAIGHTPNTGVFKAGGVECDANGYIVVKPGSTRTSVPGVFAAGDVADHEYRQAITAAGTGCMAALDAEEYLQERGHVSL